MLGEVMFLLVVELFNTFSRLNRKDIAHFFDCRMMADIIACYFFSYFLAIIDDVEVPFLQLKVTVARVSRPDHTNIDIGQCPTKKILMGLFIMWQTYTTLN